MFEISFRGVIDSVELSKSNLFVCVEPDSFSMQYFAYKTVICINNTKFKVKIKGFGGSLSSFRYLGNYSFFISKGVG